MRTRNNYKIHSNLSEAQIEADVSNFFGYLSPPELDRPFRLLDVNEQETGADKRFDQATPIFLQFKKSLGLKSIDKVPTSNRKNRSKLEDIREYRRENDLEYDPTLYFQLRKKAEKALDLQHNVLFAHEKPPSSRAVYVAPLILDKDLYYKNLCDSSERYLLDPFYYRLRMELYDTDKIRTLNHIPFLKEHVSIPPHQKVTDHKHFYAYSQTGTDVSWHSPKTIGRGPFRLSDFLTDVLSFLYRSPDSAMPTERAAEIIMKTSEQYGYQHSSKNTSPISKFHDHGNWINNQYQIKQFILLSDSNYLNEIRQTIRVNNE